MDGCHPTILRLLTFPAKLHNLVAWLSILRKTLAQHTSAMSPLSHAMLPLLTAAANWSHASHDFVLTPAGLSLGLRPCAQDQCHCLIPKPPRASLKSDMSRMYTLFHLPPCPSNLLEAHPRPWALGLQRVPVAAGEGQQPS